MSAFHQSVSPGLFFPSYRNLGPGTGDEGPHARALSSDKVAELGGNYGRDHYQPDSSHHLMPRRRK